MEAAELVALGVDIVKEAERNDACVRLLGGVAVAMLCADALNAEPSLRRTPNDIDLAGYSRQSSTIERTLISFGFEPAKEFNFLNAGRRLIYFRRRDRVKIDVFLDEFRMCHRLSWKGRLELMPFTLSLTDLLLTKLQVVEFAMRDVLDIYAILLQAGGGSAKHLPGEVLDIDRVVEICSRNWAWYKTIISNLAVVASHTSDALQEASSERAMIPLVKLTAAIQGSRKSLGWKIRALIGERLRWYEIPEESVTSN
jgi:hypothetical protein